MSIKILRSLKDEEWLELFRPNWSISSIIRSLGIQGESTQMRNFVLEKAKQLDRLEIRNASNIKKGDPSYTKENLNEVIENSKCWSDVLRQLGLSIHGFNVRTIKKYVKLYKISHDHFDPHSCMGGSRRDKYSNDELFAKNTNVTRSVVKTRILKLGLKPYQCVICGNDGIWMGQELKLQLDHIDGDCTNNELSNLRFLCLNCHSQTPTYCGKKRIQ